jgi:hypothetical protein
MGMDVIGVFQVRDKDEWTFLKKYYDGQRFILRHWLGLNAVGGFIDAYQIKPLVEIEHTRGLPDDFEQSANAVVPGYEHMGLTTIDCIGGWNRSWLDVDEILRALPVLGRRTFTVPLSIVRDLMAQNASPEHWESVCKEMEWSDIPPAPRLIEVTPRDVNVDCVIDCIEGWYRSWLDVDEILRALPVLGRRTFTVSLSIVRDLIAQNASPEHWKSVCQGMKCLGHPPAPRLIEVTPRDVNVDCVFDFTDFEIREFTDEIAELRRSHDRVRFVYGFN